jgi:hypothetical protein
MSVVRFHDLVLQTPMNAVFLGCYGLIVLYAIKEIDSVRRVC